VDGVETAAERRRKAIMAALEPNTISASNPTPKASTSSFGAGSSSKTGTMPAKREREMVVQTNMEMPSIPKDIMARKRQLPWEEDVG
jgi:hypothetical protein